MTDARASNPILYDGEARILEIRADHPALADTVVVVSGGTRVPLARVVGVILREWHAENLSVKRALEDIGTLETELAHLRDRRAQVETPPPDRAQAWRRARWAQSDPHTWLLKCRVQDGGAVIGMVQYLNSRAADWRAGSKENPTASGIVSGVYEAQRAVRKALREAAHVE